MILVAARVPVLIIAAACLMPPAYSASVYRASVYTASVTHSPRVIVARRGWHIDVGFAVTELEPPLSSIAADLPTAQYLFFGFGDLHYLMSKNHDASTLAAALWPGWGIMLVTGIENRPRQAFGADQIVELDLGPQEAHALQDLVWRSFITNQGEARILRPGPYEGSLYFPSTQRYSALHTCNTWAAEALQEGRLHVHSRGVLFAGQLWAQVRRLEKKQRPAPSLAPALSIYYAE